jgi:D-xylose transport system permease protein
MRGSVRDGERGPLLVIAGLIVIWCLFQALDDNFLSPRNLSNLSVDIVGTGLVAVGIVFVLLIREIDLSVGSVSGLAGAVFAVLNVNHGMPEWLAVVVAIAVGMAVGAFHGFFFAWLGVPAFVVTLAGLLIWNGLTLYLLGASGTINIDEEGLVASLTSRHFGDDIAAYAVAALGTAGYFLAARHKRARHRAAGMPYRPPVEIWVRTGILAVLAFTAAYTLDRFQGLPLALLIFLVVLVVSDYVLRRTRYGRRVYALGGGVEAARRAGIAVERVRVAMFMVSGTLAAVGGLTVRGLGPDVGEPHDGPCGRFRDAADQRDRRGRHRWYEPVRRAWLALVRAARCAGHPVGRLGHGAAGGGGRRAVHDHGWSAAGRRRGRRALQTRGGPAGPSMSHNMSEVSCFLRNA